MPAEPLDYVLGHLHEAFASDPRVSDESIQATLRGRKLFITGKVQTRERKESISVVASEVARDYEIHNEVTVVHPTGPDSAEELD